MGTALSNNNNKKNTLIMCDICEREIITSKVVQLFFLLGKSFNWDLLLPRGESNDNQYI